MIHMKNVGFQYGADPLFSQLNLDIPKGNIYGLLGVNGAGKTTLLKLISGQLFPSTGEISVLGYTPKDRDPQMLADLFHLPEEFHLPQVRPDRYIATYAPFYPRFDREAFNRYCDEFRLTLNLPLQNLSFGQKKKFLLSFGLASNTSLLILDEPTNGLDIPSKSQFRRTVASAMTEDRTFIISTHQVRDMENLIDPIIIIDSGAVVFNNALEAVSRSFCMTLEREEPQDSDALYTEKIPGGYMTIRVRDEMDTETSVDLETLFNAVISHPNLLSTGGAQ